MYSLSVDVETFDIIKYLHALHVEQDAENKIHSLREDLDFEKTRRMELEREIQYLKTNCCCLKEVSTDSDLVEVDTYLEFKVEKFQKSVDISEKVIIQNLDTYFLVSSSLLSFFMVYRRRDSLCTLVIFMSVCQQFNILFYRINLPMTSSATHLNLLALQEKMIPLMKKILALVCRFSKNNCLFVHIITRRSVYTVKVAVVL